MTRVFIIAGNVTGRVLIGDVLRSSGAEVAGTAPNIKIGLDKIRQSPVDVVTIARSTCPDADTLAPLLRTHKLSSRVLIHKNESEDSVRQEILPFYRSIVRARPATPVFNKIGADVELVVIGASTGGPVALATVLTGLQPLSVPILIVQHMPLGFTAPFAERLSKQGSIHVREAVSGTIIQAGEGWIAPADYHMVVKRTPDGLQLLTHKGAPENSCRPAVDVLFRSASECCGNRTLAVVLTGMGQDGLVGAKMLSAAGATIIVQNEASSVIWGMPGAIAKAGIASQILPLDEIAAEIVRLTTKSYLRPASS